MIKKRVEINLTGIELYAVQEIQIDSTGGVTPLSVVAKDCYMDADIYINYQIVKLQNSFGKDNVNVVLDRLKNEYRVKVSYDTEVVKGSFTVIYAITKLFL